MGPPQDGMAILVLKCLRWTVVWEELHFTLLFWPYNSSQICILPEYKLLQNPNPNVHVSASTLLDFSIALGPVDARSSWSFLLLLLPCYCTILIPFPPLWVFPLCLSQWLPILPLPLTMALLHWLSPLHSVPSFSKLIPTHNFNPSFRPY